MYATTHYGISQLITKHYYHCVVNVLRSKHHNCSNIMTIVQLIDNWATHNFNS